MRLNTHPETGVAYGVIALNNLDPDVAQELWYGPQAKDLSYEDALKELRVEIELEANQIEADVEEDAKIEAAELGGLTDREQEAFVDRAVERNWTTLGYDDRDDYVVSRLERECDDIQIMEPVIEGVYEGVIYWIDWLGGAPLLWVFESPFITRARPCSPCAPGAGDLDSLDPETGIECYDVPPTWRDTN